MPQRLTESLPLAVAEAPSATPGRLLVQLISPGWGSSGYYSRPVLENAAADKVWPAGTHVYFDHPTESEMHDRPERSVRDLAAILSEDAYVVPDGGLVAEADIIGPYRELLTDDTFMRAVGMSIRASADTTVGEAEGRQGTIVTRLVEGVSVDVVTKAGRGGRILAAVESARASLAREASTEDARDRLTRALRASTDEWAYVMDFDPEAGVVWFETDGGTFEQAYTLTTDGADLVGDPVEVRRVVTYPRASSTTDASEADIFAEHMRGASHGELSRTFGMSPTKIAEAIARQIDTLKPPVAPAGSTPTHESQEDTMSTTTIEESRLAALEADAGRVQTLESERDTATARATAAENRAAAVEALAESGHTFTKLEKRGLLSELPVTEAGELDREAFDKAIKEAATERGSDPGTGVTGFGSTAPGDTVTESTTDGWDDIDARLGITKEA